MAKQQIDQFIWGYQEHFRIGLNRLCDEVLTALGAEIETKTFLVAVLVADSELTIDENRDAVCIEPEEDKGLVSLFSCLRDRVLKAQPQHEMQRMHYGSEQARHDKPQRIWNLVVREEIRSILSSNDEACGTRSFVGAPVRVGNYRVAPVIQISTRILEEYPPLQSDVNQYGTFHKSLLDAAVQMVLDEGARQLESPKPGQSFSRGTRSPNEVAILAAEAFLNSPSILISDAVPDFALMQKLNDISLMRYERGEGIGRMLLVNKSHPSLQYLVKLETPVPLRNARWARKMLEVANGRVSVVADSKMIVGFGRLASDHDPANEDAFWVDFIGHHQWNFRRGDQILLRTRHGTPLLPQEAITKTRFVDNIERHFGLCDPDKLWTLYRALIDQDRGAMLMIADDAEAEAARLANQGTKIVPLAADPELITSAVRIDGTILIDPTGICHAIGVILDGPANDLCSAARGSRFNSALRYVGASSASRVAIVLSEDRTIDIHPLLRRKIDRDLVETNLAALEIATIDNFYEPREFINQNRFYLTPDQCERANAALRRINELPVPVGRIKWTTEPLVPAPEMNDGYYI